jgi:hypothetical protein
VTARRRVLRRIAWAYVAIGLVIALGWPIYVTVNLRRTVAAYRPIVEGVRDFPRAAGTSHESWERQRTEGWRAIRAARALSPWPGVIGGTALAALAALVLLALGRGMSAGRDPAVR